jgi:hypothetical protein
MRIFVFMVSWMGSIASASAAEGVPPGPPVHVSDDRPVPARACLPPTSVGVVVLPDGSKMQAQTADCTEPSSKKD